MTNDTPTSTDDELDEILVQMLEKHEMELTPVHTPPSEYDSVEEAKSAIKALYAKREREAMAQTALDVMTQYKSDRIDHTLSTPADEWERELETADKTLATYLSQLTQDTKKGEGI